jgi:homoaconitate hydratase family protein
MEGTFMNLVEKILSRASGKASVTPGEIIEARVDVAMIHDLTGPLTVKTFAEMGGTKVWDKDRIVVIFDHLVPANSERAATNQKILREFVRKQGIGKFYDVGRGGICHQVMVEKGHVKPGQLVVGADSHTCTYGAVGAFATGMGATDMAAVFLEGKTWLKVPETIKVNLEGQCQDLTTPKDLILYTIGRIGADGAVYKAIEFGGEAVRAMGIDGRMTFCNMAVEMGAKTGIVEPDQKTIDYLASRTSLEASIPRNDPDASYSETYTFDVGSLGPQVACPPSVDDVKPVEEVEGIPIDQAYIGSCTNGRIEDLRIAARIAKGRKVKDGVRAIIVPASQEVYLQALREGLMETLIGAGALICDPTCGACIGAHMGVLADGEVCIASINRNFIGRMGSTKAKVYLASPATVMASAIEGRIKDPRSLGGF